MKWSKVRLGCLLASACIASPSIAQVSRPSKLVQQIHLEGLSAAEAAALIEKMKGLQLKLKAGTAGYFELLSGAPASYKEVNLTPRDAFLNIRFDEATFVNLLAKENWLRQRYEIIVQKSKGG
jgi:hypothetical protein